ncbi:alpha/beta fold hydrolase [Paralimibaculum aggregatum]|uniref:Alpha/beta fold hydrolase n=1 Tax=Paralimibaculum aggregatum TaxID=3036245 RepID=A0ABQ6LBT8_9RHOB|nr:dienelactone hydrolase family protein [Limibaculum sp. NKW23]GMG80853.1 alpha/beta fold hydrolase [Limibaculum sp. NKW23]
MTQLTGPRAAPKSGTARQLVILLHGYGADGNDLIGLARPMADYLPDTAFFAPDAPQPCRVNPAGRQWFPIPPIDGSSEVEMHEGYVAAAELLDSTIEAAIAEAGVGREATALLGFSQGTMMALSVGPRRAPGLAGIVGFSGRLIDHAALGLAEARPPVLLVHGDADEVVPHSSLAEAEKGLSAAGFPVNTFTSKGTGHGIAPDGLGLATGFLAEVFGLGPLTDPVD